MMVEPEIILLDEVGAGVNKTLLKKISNIIKKLNKEKKYTFIMIEHDLDFISKLCKFRLLLLDSIFLLVLNKWFKEKDKLFQFIDSLLPFLPRGKQEGATGLP